MIRRQTGYHSSVLQAQALLNAIGVSLSYFFIGDAGSPLLTYSQMTTSLLSLLIYFCLKYVRPVVSPSESVLFFFANIVCVLPTIWISNHVLSLNLTSSWAPFQGHKLMVLAQALFAPPILYAGITGTVIIGFMALLQYFLFGYVQKERAVGGEPWITLVFAVFGIVLFLIRMRAAVLEDKQQKMKSLLRAFALKDLTNTPLQTIAMNAELLLTRHPEEAEPLMRIDRSVEKISTIGRLADETVARSEKSIQGGLSFDAEKILRRR